MDASRMPRPTKRLRIRPHTPVNGTCCGTAAHTGAALRTWTDCPASLGAGASSSTVRHKAAVLHPLTGWGRRPLALPGVAPSADGAMDAWGFRPLRRATKGSAFGNRDLGCPPPVGKSGRRGILRQGKVWLRRHTGCMARSRTAAMAEKARRAPQTHGWWAALTRKKSSKTFNL